MTATLVALCLLEARVMAQQSSAPANSTPASADEVIEILNKPAPRPVAQPPLPEIKLPVFTTCSVAELRQAVPELKELKVSPDSSSLGALLDKIGAKVAEITHRTPNLLSEEAVVLDLNGIITHQNYSFLTLHHLANSKSVVVDEFRVDATSGEKFESDIIEKLAEAKTASDSSETELPSGTWNPKPGGPPLSQGFFSQWLNFYPTNRQLIDFRYLGEQKLHGRKTLVVAFSQKPGVYPVPMIVEDNGKFYKLFTQGVAWVDAADLRILRLRTGLLSLPGSGVVTRMDADLDFSEVRIAEVAWPLWLPKQVVVTINAFGSTQRESHTYSNYRLFRAKSKLLLNP